MTLYVSRLVALQCSLFLDFFVHLDLVVDLEIIEAL
jgi:hypothetical protein